MMKMGIAGAGKIVNEVINFIGDIKAIDVTAIYSRSKLNQDIECWCQNNGIEKVYSNYDAMLLDEMVEVVYVAVPNHLHYEFCKKALLQNKHVICEKPFTSNNKELESIHAIAEQNHLMLFEAISNQYLPNYLEIKKQVTQLGAIKIVECNYSQYSTRYQAFKNGEILPAFDRNMSGGALMDINVYNIHFVVGLFGKPAAVHYYANIEQGIDVSGMLIMDYKKFKCVCIGAKDCSAPISTNIQGDEGCIHLNSATNRCDQFEQIRNDSSRESYALNQGKHRMYYEFETFAKLYIEKDYQKMYENLEHSKIVMDILTEARKTAGIQFPGDDSVIII